MHKNIPPTREGNIRKLDLSCKAADCDNKLNSRQEGVYVQRAFEYTELNGVCVFKIDCLISAFGFAAFHFINNSCIGIMIFVIQFGIGAPAKLMLFSAAELENVAVVKLADKQYKLCDM